MYKLFKYLLVAGSFLGTFAVTACIALVLAWPVQLLWNWLMPVIFHLPELAFWQAFGLQLLGWLLLGTKFSLDARTSNN